MGADADPVHKVWCNQDVKSLQDAYARWFVRISASSPEKVPKDLIDPFNRKGKQHDC